MVDVCGSGRCGDRLEKEGRREEMLVRRVEREGEHSRNGVERRERQRENGKDDERTGRQTYVKRR
jgi:hypothetical protein